MNDSSSKAMAHNVDRFTTSWRNAEMLMCEAVRLRSTMEQVGTYMDLYGADPITLQSGRQTIVAPAYEVYLRADRRL